MLDNLGQFTGSQVWYRTINPSITYTEGVKYVADECQAYWLVDDIAIYQSITNVRREEFQVWTLRTDLEKHTAVLTCEDGNGRIVYEHKIEMTTFPVTLMTFWYTNNVILLPSEY